VVTVDIPVVVEVAFSVGIDVVKVGIDVVKVGIDVVNRLRQIWL